MGEYQEGEKAREGNLQDTSEVKKIIDIVDIVYGTKGDHVGLHELVEDVRYILKEQGIETNINVITPSDSDLKAFVKKIIPEAEYASFEANMSLMTERLKDKGTLDTLGVIFDSMRQHSGPIREYFKSVYQKGNIVFLNTGMYALIADLIDEEDLENVILVDAYLLHDLRVSREMEITTSFAPRHIRSAVLRNAVNRAANKVFHILAHAPHYQRGGFLINTFRINAFRSRKAKRYTPNKIGFTIHNALQPDEEPKIFKDSNGNLVAVMPRSIKPPTAVNQQTINVIDNIIKAYDNNKQTIIFITGSTGDNLVDLEKALAELDKFSEIYNIITINEGTEEQQKVFEKFPQITPSNGYINLTEMVKALNLQGDSAEYLRALVGNQEGIEIPELQHNVPVGVSIIGHGGAGTSAALSSLLNHFSVSTIALTIFTEQTRNGNMMGKDGALVSVRKKDAFNNTELLGKILENLTTHKNLNRIPDFEGHKKLEERNREYHLRLAKMVADYITSLKTNSIQEA